MNKLLKTLFLSITILISSFTWVVGNAKSGTTLTTDYGNYTVLSSIKVHFSGMSGDYQDWIGIYHKGDSNDWNKVVAWKWTGGEKNGTVSFENTFESGAYEIRAFFKNEFEVKAATSIRSYIPGASGSDPLVRTDRVEYAPNASVWVNTEGYLSGDEDWIGIYAKGDNNDWKNVIRWNWVNQVDKMLSSTVLNQTNKGNGKLPAGEYEARLFFHNSFNLESTSEFSVVDDAAANNSNSLFVGRPSYEAKKDVNKEINVIFDGFLSGGNHDWVGIYRKGDKSNWSNVYAWNWISKNSAINETWLSIKRKDMPVGDYEVRLFFNNTYDLVSKVPFSITGAAQTNFENYGSYDYQNLQGEDVPGISGGLIKVYKPKINGVVRQNAPVVIVGTGGWSGYPNRLEGFISFIVSKGYFVIGVGTQPAPEEEAARILKTINHYKNTGLIDTSKIGVMGSSTGGGMIFHNMKKIQDAHFASNSNFVISLDGSFAWGLKISEIEDLHTTSLLLQFGGADGLTHSSGKRYQDPTVMMTIYDHLPANDEKAFSYVNDDTHSIGGSMDGRDGILKVVGAMLAYKFENGGQAAKNIALTNKVDEIQDEQLEQSGYYYSCKWDRLVDGVWYDYCNANNLKPN